MGGRVWDLCFDALRWQGAVGRLDSALEALRAEFDTAELTNEPADTGLVVHCADERGHDHRVTIECRRYPAAV